MKFKQYYSSSSGNLYTVTAGNGKRLLIECGVTWPKIQAALEYNLEGIEACLLTHEHKDHSKGIEGVMKSGIDVWSSQETFEALGIAGTNRRALYTSQNHINPSLDGFNFKSFKSHHDAVAPLLFTIGCCCPDAMLFATDTSHIKQKFNTPFSIIAIECSYDRYILQERVDTGSINESLAKRLLTSHMEKEATIRYLEDSCDLSKCREIHLLHMSTDNIEAEATRQEIEDKFMIKTITVWKD